MDLSLGVSCTSVPSTCCCGGESFPPSGFVFVTDEDGRVLLDDAGNALIVEN